MYTLAVLHCMPFFEYPLRNRNRLWFTGKLVQHLSNIDETLGSVPSTGGWVGWDLHIMFVGDRKKLHELSKIVLCFNLNGWLFCFSCKATEMIKSVGRYKKQGLFKK